MTKGIVLAGGTGTRLYPTTKIINKHILPVYDKPMIYYSLSVLMLAGIRDILIISSKQNLKSFKSLLGNGSKLGVSIKYQIQNKAVGIPDAFRISKGFIKKERVALILGDNIFYGQGFIELLKKANESDKNICFGYTVKNPSEYGIIEFDKNNKIHSLKEKPKQSKHFTAVTGLYFFNCDVIEHSKKLRPSRRSELEIVDILNIYRKKKTLEVFTLGRGFAWLDAGTHETLLDASLFVKTVEQRQGLKIACLEEISFLNKWINKKQLVNLIKNNESLSYKTYLKQLLKD
tara:strand:+ start:605 stop:1471 length:867 start_codon:yes stop_codon:yes gene_type:complete